MIIVKDSDEVPKNEIWFVDPKELEYVNAYEILYNIKLPLTVLCKIIDLEIE